MSDAAAGNLIHQGEDSRADVVPAFAAVAQHAAFAADMLDLPTDRWRNPRCSSVMATTELALGEWTFAQLRSACEARALAPASGLSAIWATLLARLSGQTEIVFGLVSRGHTQAVAASDGASDLPMLLQLDVSDDPSLAELQSRVQKRLDATSAPGGDAGHTHIEPVGQRKGAVTTASLQSLVVIDCAVPPSLKTQCELNLVLDSHPQEGWRARLEYAADLFKPESALRIGQYFSVLLQGMLTDGRQRVSELPLLNDAQARALLEGLNNTGLAYDREQCLHELFERQAVRTPAASALAHDGRVLSYRELNARANRLAAFLREQGIGPDERVGLCARRSPAMAVAMLAIAKAGGAWVPLDPVYPADRLTQMLEDSGAKLLLCDAPEVDLAVDIRKVDLLRDAAQWADLPAADLPKAGLGADHLAYVIYTSGSTGRPKGVALTHRNAVNFVHWAHQAFSADELRHVLWCTSMCFDLSIFECFAPLTAGGCVELVDNALSLLEKQPPVSLVNTVPSAMAELVKAGAVPASVQVINLAGEALQRELAERILASTGVERLCNLYGPTETTTYSTWTSMDRTGGFVPHIGRPVANTRVYVLDRRGKPAPLGVTGEIHIAGDGVARGYLGQEALTEERFIADPWGQPGSRMYRTGDLGRWRADGQLDYLGRNDFQVKVRGFRIELGEIESRLRRLPAVEEAAVLAREDHPGDKRLVAYVTAKAGETVVGDALRTGLSDTLPDYMVPTAFVVLDRMPQTLNGKLDRKALPAPGQDAFVNRTYEAPVSPIETAIADMWRALLRVDRVGRHDHFFDLGGHSLLAVQFIARAASALNVDLSLREVFAHPVLSDLAQSLATAASCSFAPIEPADRSQPLALSWAQQRLWFLDQLDRAAGAAYHLPFAVRLAGDLNRAALGAALDTIVARHEALRTNFTADAGIPAQRIAPADIGCPLPLVDLRALPSADRMAQAQQLAEFEAAQPFDLAAGPLLRGRVLRLAEDDHILLLTQHHIVSDGWSIRVLLNELSALYAASIDELPNSLPALPIQYVDYAAWQRDWLQGEQLQRQLDFWRGHLANAPALIELPTDRPRPSVQSYRGGRVAFSLDVELSTAVRALGRRHGATLFMTLLTGFSVLLARLSGQSDLVIGAPVANRRRAELEPLIGFFVNTLALRVQLGDHLTVADLLAHVKDATLAAYAHQDAPFEQVVEAVQPTRSLGHSPLFQVVLALDNTPGEGALRLPGLDVASMELAQRTTHFDLMLSLTEVDGALGGAFEYATDLFDAATVERMAGYLHTLLAAMCADDRCLVARLPLLSAAEHRQIVEGFNDTTVDYPADGLIHHLFEAQAAQQHDAVAVVVEDRQLSYGELNARANRLAHHLIATGVRPDDHVAVHLERGLDMIVGLLGILKAGAGYVPLDPDYPADRLAHMLADSAPRALLTQSGLASTLPSHGLPTLLLDDAAVVRHLADLPDANPDVTGLSARHAAYVMYTSGSTGTPKGVVVEHRNVLRLVIGSTYAPITRNDCVAQCANVAFDASTWEIWSALLNGARLLVVPRSVVLNPARFGEMLVQRGATSLWLTVGLFNQYAEQLAPTFSRLRHLLVGGDVLDPAIIRRLIDDGHAPPLLMNGYGPTETTTFAATFAIASIAQDAISIPIGRPIANTRIYILDAHGQPVPIGVTGEIFIGGAGVARGYLNRPELTAERFLADPFSAEPGARMYKTGDLARWLPDGNIEYLGRNDFQVKIRGFRIELGEIEARLAACAGIREASVIAREDSPGDKRLVAYFVAAEGAAPSAADLRAQLAVELPDFMLPTAFARLATFPLTPNGKLDRKALPAPDDDAVIKRLWAAPQGETEQQLAAIWQAALKLERVGRYDNFFELGGHSLLAVAVLERARAAGLSLDLRALFASPNLMETAQAIAQTRAEQQAAPAPLDANTQAILIRRGQGVPLFLVHDGYGDELYFHALAKHLPASLPIFGLPAPPLDDAQPDDVPAMAARLLALIRAAAPKGPYRLAGWSFGGVLAWEIARQLVDGGETVGFLGLLDTFAPSPQAAVAHKTPVQILRDLCTPAQAPSTPPPSDDADFAAWFAWFASQHAMPENFAGLTAADVATRCARLSMHLPAAARYRPPHLDIGVTVFAASEGREAKRRESGAALGWRQHASEWSLNVIAIEGSHFSMMQPPHIQHLGKALARAMAQADLVLAPDALDNETQGTQA